MSEYQVGYKKPPVPHRFMPGVSGNPKGRPKRLPTDLAGIIVNVLDAPVEYQEGGRIKTASGRVLTVMMLVKRAVKGDVEAALALLQTRIQAERTGTSQTELIEISDWTPDFSGQTAEQKTQAYLNKKNAAPVEWWTGSDSAQLQPNPDRK
jgi:hypothetical protein